MHPGGMLLWALKASFSLLSWILREAKKIRMKKNYNKQGSEHRFRENFSQNYLAILKLHSNSVLSVSPFEKLSRKIIKKFLVTFCLLFCGSLA